MEEIVGGIKPIYHHYIIDMSSNNNFVENPTMQGDGNEVRGIEIELIANGTQYVIDKDNTIVSIAGTKPDTMQILNECAVTDEGYILVDVTSQMSAVKGRGDYCIMLIDKNKNSQIKSFPFYIMTTSAPFNIDQIISSDEFQLLSKTLSDAQTEYTYVIESAKASANAAKASEDAAKKSENNAKISETNTEAYMNNASDSAANSASSAILAENWAIGSTNSSKYYATQSSISATSAEASKDNAKISETNTANYAKTAKESETNAKISETNAKTSETNAKSSETAASTSASTASTKATEASNSEKAAKTSETNAKTSETNAAASESSAAQSASTASSEAKNAADSATEAESYARGGTGTRENEDIDNAKKYYEQAKAISESFAGALRPMGTVIFANLPTVSNATEGDMYNISNQFTTTSDFKEGAGNVIPAGANVYKTTDGKWDVLAGTPVTGVKGNAENSYRKGNVNITKGDIGLENVDNTADIDKSVSHAETATKATHDGNGNNIVDIYQTKTGNTTNNSVTFTSEDSTAPTTWADVTALASGEKHSSIFNKVSTMFKNVRYLYKMLGTTDISALGDGTCTGAIAAQNEALATVNATLNKQYIQYGVATCKYYTNYFLRVTVNLPKKYRGSFVGFVTKATNTAEANRHASCLVDGNANTISIYIEDKDGGFTQSDIAKAFWMTVGVL